ncbi:MAG: PduL/EutD family phosphate acyltransferase, partial [Bacillota bacterium]|nr:PduL/EutD family phosphate acyltransferase [Bacillota bacterium]
TDARTLGVKVPVRESGDIKGSAGVKLIGPKGEVTIGEGIIAAKRHMHVTPEDAAKLGLKDKQLVSIKVGGDRALTFSEVVVRVSEKFATRVHLDVDEANAAGLEGETEGEIIIG